MSHCMEQLQSWRVIAEQDHEKQSQQADRAERLNDMVITHVNSGVDRNGS